MTTWKSWLLGAWCGLVLLTGAGAAVDGHREPSRPGTASGQVSVPDDVAPPTSTGSTPPPEVPPAAVVGVAAVSVGLDAPLVATGKTPDGALDVPDYGTAGWYQHSVVPGAPGAAVLAGHVDSTTGPDVFHRLGELRVGDEVLVRHADGATSRFTVHDIEVADKDELPVGRIFDEPARSELRLITCGGAFDRSARSYESNVIVYAHLSDPPASPA